MLLTGNSYASEILTGWYDASIGLYLAGDGKGNFKPLDINQSGFLVDKDAKSLVQVYNAKNKPIVIASQNSDSLRAFTTVSRVARQLIPVKNEEVYADIIYDNGKKQRQELYYGTGYLAQSSRHISVSSQVKQIQIFDYTGKSRLVTIQPQQALARE